MQIIGYYKKAPTQIEIPLQLERVIIVEVVSSPTVVLGPTPVISSAPPQQYKYGIGEFSPVPVASPRDAASKIPRAPRRRT